MRPLSRCEIILSEELRQCNPSGRLQKGARGKIHGLLLCLRINSLSYRASDKVIVIISLFIIRSI